MNTLYYNNKIVSEYDQEITQSQTADKVSKGAKTGIDTIKYHT